MSLAAPDWLEPGFAHIWLPYTQMQTARLPVPVIGVKGSRLLLADGRELIDGVASWWTVAHGYRNSHIEHAIKKQLDVLPHVMLGGLAHRQAYILAARLAALLPDPLERVFFSDSGSVAVEVAMKMAMQVWLNRGVKGRTLFVSFKGGYHGDTLGTMAICDPDEGMHSLFGPALMPQLVTDLPDTDERRAALAALLRAEKDRIAAVIVEPMLQGAGGMRIMSPETLRAIADETRAAGHLLIFDEIFTGFGRTGKMFAMEHADVVPDIVCLGKALSGGFLPIAATVASRDVFNAFLSEDPGTALMHGPTFMGNALACAAANAGLDLFEREPRLERALWIEQHLRAGLEPCRSMPGVKDVRVLGAMGAVQLERMDKDGLRAKFADAGVWIRPLGDVVYLTPALTIPEVELNTLIRAMVKVLAAHTAMS
jgi:adenosylmethionine---8-amino-7-oxononanoate aminotransferase